MNVQPHGDSILTDDSCGLTTNHAAEEVSAEEELFSDATDESNEETSDDEAIDETDDETDEVTDDEISEEYGDGLDNEISDETDDGSVDDETDDEVEGETDDENADGNVAVIEPVWETVMAGEDTRPRMAPVFQGNPGFDPSITLPETDRPHEFFNMFFPVYFLSLLRNWTNARAAILIRRYRARNPGRELPPFLASWYDCSLNEIKKLFGTVFYMGIVRKPEIHLYWSTNPMYQTPYFQQQFALSRDRFKALLSMIRFANPRNLQREDPLAKVRPYLSHLRDVFKSTFIPNQSVSIDESLVRFKLGSSFDNAFQLLVKLKKSELNFIVSPMPQQVTFRISKFTQHRRQILDLANTSIAKICH
jgi:hypothetical protein